MNVKSQKLTSNVGEKIFLQKCETSLQDVKRIQYSDPTNALSIVSALEKEIIQLLQISSNRKLLVELQRFYCRTLLYKSQICYSNGDFESSFSSAQLVLDKARLLLFYDLEVSALLQIAHCKCKYENRYDDAIRIYREAISLAQQCNNESLEMQAKGYLALTLSDMGDFVAATRYYQDVLSHAEKTRTQLQVYNIIINYSIHLNTVGLHNQALDQLYKILDLIRNSDDKEGYSALLNNIGLTLKNLSLDKESQIYFFEAAEIRKNLGFIPGYLKALNNYALSLLKSGNNLEAREVVEEVITQAKKHNINESLVIAYLTLIDIISYSTNKETIWDTIEELEPILSKLPLARLHTYFYQTLCSYFTGTENYEKVIEYGLRGLEYSEKQQYSSATVNLLTQLSEAYAAIKDYEKAYTLAKRSQNLFLSISTNEEKTRTEVLIAQLYADKERYELSLLKKERERLSAELERKNTQLSTEVLRVLEKQELIQSLIRELKILRETPDSLEKPSITHFHTVLEKYSKLSDNEQKRVYDDLNKVSNDFVTKLSYLYPLLSPSELKVSSLLRLHLSSKEIASLLHITDRAVEKHRLHIRKKLGLPSDINLPKHFAMVVVEK